MNQEKVMASLKKIQIPVLLLFSLLAGTIIVDAVDYTVTNNAAGTPGGDRFDKEIGIDYTLAVLSSATDKTLSLFHQPPYGRKTVGSVSTIVESFNGVAFTSEDSIHVSSDYISGYSGDVKVEITGVLYHEMVHVWQWNGNGKANGGLIEGIADYVRLKAGYAPSHWVRPGQGDRWDQGYDVTAYFLDYCEGIRVGFVADLNEKMSNGYSDGFFSDLLGKSVDQLWTEYKAHYDN